MNTLYIAGQFRSIVGDTTAWELLGVFSTKELAEAACLESHDFVMPMELDCVAPRQTTVNLATYYPKGLQ